ncbi:glycosyltransferase family 4 protein [Methylocapsa acidiphila]|uniref:glycosyltransferase family 4 protein n=1 Tax=Methylocapsa acidiphila TaxID=133552 RepID=UPI0018DD3A74|nr:glycosyltransferase family 4 protein [Methylocapsa acidiphila]
MNLIEQEIDDRPVLMLTPGGLENGGGIGRLVGYVVGAWRDKKLPPMTVIDTRGPKTVLAWPFFMTACLVRILLYAPRRPLLHIHLANGGSTLRKIIIMRFGRLLGLDMIIHLHDPDYGGFYLRLPPWARAVVRAMFLSATKVIVLGEAAKVATTDLLLVPAERVEIVANGVPAPSAVSPPRNSAQPRILFLGYLCRRKGVHDLIEALARPQLRALDWRAVLAGGGAEEDKFAAQAAGAGLGQRIEFPGWVDRAKTQSLLAEADILVLPSYAEGMAMSVLEGMAFGLCVVCTPAGALAEVVEDGASALVVTPGDVEGLAAALAAAITDLELRRRLGRGAREAFLRGYNIADYPERIVAVYRRALAHKSEVAKSVAG